MALRRASKASITRAALFRWGPVLGLALSLTATVLHPMAHTLLAPQTENTVLVYDGHPTDLHVEAEVVGDLVTCEVCLLGSRLRTTPLRASVLLPQLIAQGSLFLDSPPWLPAGFRQLHPPRGPPLL